ncbi:MAG: hypothetical protein Q9175_006313 [Cornicularia normoerica]
MSAPYEIASPPSLGVSAPLRGATFMLRRGLVLDLSVAFGLGTTFGYLYWYGYHVPATRKRDLFYAKLEREREENQGTV